MRRRVNGVLDQLEAGIDGRAWSQVTAGWRGPDPIRKRTPKDIPSIVWPNVFIVFSPPAGAFIRMSLPIVLILSGLMYVPCTRTTPVAVPSAFAAEQTNPPRSPFSRSIIVKFITSAYSDRGNSVMRYLWLWISLSPVERSKVRANQMWIERCWHTF